MHVTANEDFYSSILFKSLVAKVEHKYCSERSWIVIEGLGLFEYSIGNIGQYLRIFIMFKDEEVITFYVF